IAVHPGEHQHVTRVGFLCNDGHQAVFIPTNVIDPVHCRECSNCQARQLTPGPRWLGEYGHMQTCSAHEKPLALTMGDACGIGPEVIVRLWQSHTPQQTLVVGCVEVMQRAVAAVQQAFPDIAVPEVVEVSDPRAWAMGGRQVLAATREAILPVWRPPGLPHDVVDAPLGAVDRRAGVAAAACVRGAVRLAQEGTVAGIVTAPLHKEALALAGEPYPGHTELLQAEGAPPGQPPAPVRMMLANGSLKTVLVTIHVSLRQAI